MTSLLLAPADVLLFRDGVPPESAGGAGGGGRLPLPGTVHQAFRSALLSLTDREIPGKLVAGPGGRGSAPSAFASLRTAGPLPWHPGHGHLFPVPLDASRVWEGIRRHRLLPVSPGHLDRPAGAFLPPCLPAPDVWPGVETAFDGWWTAAQLRHYLAGESAFDAGPLGSGDLWVEDAHATAGTCLRLRSGVRLAIQAGLASPPEDEAEEFKALLRHGQMLLGADRRLVRFERKNAAWPVFDKPAAPIGEGPFHLRWVLLTPALFAHGSLPGWCRSSLPQHPLPEGAVCLRKSPDAPFLRAHLVAHHLGRPLAVRGWDSLNNCAKPCQVAVPAGSVYHFLCADADNADRLARLLHGRFRSDFLGEKGFGLGLCAKPEPVPAPDFRALAGRLFAT